MLKVKLQNSVSLFTLLAISFSLWNFSCEQAPGLAEEISLNNFEFVELTKSGEQINGLILPEGTEVWEGIQDGEKMIKFVYPEGVELVGINGDREVQSFGGKTYWCDCDKPGRSNRNCDIVRSGGVTSCKKVACKGECKLQVHEWQQLTPNQQTPIFIDKSLGIQFIKENEEHTKYPSAPEFLLEVPEVKLYVENLRKGIKDADETKVAFLNIYGHVLGIEIPVFYEKTQNEKHNLGKIKTMNSFEDVDCECLSGWDGCDKIENKKKGSVTCKQNGCELCFMLVEK